MASPALKDTLGRGLRDLRVSVTDRCNFRCGYCMPAEIFGESYAFLPRAEILSFEELERVARVFVGLGVRKLRVTGGEPLLRKDLPLFIEAVAAIPGLEDLALTTNASSLAAHAGALAHAGLRRITISLDSIDPSRFAKLNGRGLPLERVLLGIDAAERVGLAPIKINTVVIRDQNEDDVVAIAEHFRGTGHIVRFIEFMDVGTLNRWDLRRVVPAREILERIHAVHPVEPVEPSYDGEVARRYRYVDGAGEIGIIASVTQPFCRGCHRARLSADGHLVTCLFSDTGTDLKTPLREGASDAELAAIIRDVWAGRSDRYSEQRASLAARSPENASPGEPSGRIEMYRIGG